MKIKIVISIFLCIFLAVCTFFFFYGNPISRSQSIEIVEDYVRTKYSEHSFNISDVNHYPGEGIFIVHVISMGGGVEGDIDVKKGKVINEEFSVSLE